MLNRDGDLFLGEFNSGDWGVVRSEFGLIELYLSFLIFFFFFFYEKQDAF